MRPGFVEGGGAGGAGAGGFCASAGGTRSPMASASRTKIGGHECIGLSQGEYVPAANLVGESVQVKVNNVYKSETTRLLPRAIFWSKVSFETARCYPHATQFMRAWMRCPWCASE